MKEFFYTGGPLFMGILTVLLILMVAWAIINLLAFLKDKSAAAKIRKRLVHVKSIGLFSIITGILGQLIGIYMAFTAIEQAGDISPVLIFGGLKVSMITTLYGTFIYLASLLIWVIIDLVMQKAN